MITTDILVIGGGIAGLSFVAKAAKWFPDLQITLLTKDTCIESNTRYAQGGIAIAIDSTRDSFQKHIEDTMVAGAGLCNPVVVEKVVSEGPSRLIELIEWGVQFDRDAAGQLALSREGGHTAHRIIHYKDATGYEIAQALLQHLSLLPNVTLLDHHFVIDLITQVGSNGNVACKGVVAMDIPGNAISTFSARVTLLATGGAGQVFETTTNPVIATGDGIAMAYRAGAKISDMEFMQFHPTAFFSETDNPSFLISEAMRGFGAYLRDEDGRRFVFDYDPRGELASRDIISKAIHHEVSVRGKNAVYLDCTHLPAEELKVQFPTIYRQCLQKGVDITKDMIPVAPAAHYMCGGVAVDLQGRTSLENLYACGECSFTGLHGANRLASNSLLEALVFAHEIFMDIEKNIRDIASAQPIVFTGKCLSSAAYDAWVDGERKAIREKMSRFAGIVKCYRNLEDTLSYVEGIRSEVDRVMQTELLTPSLCELRNVADVSKLILLHSLNRKENKGTYYNSDLITYA
jgi:L-aspartate oxidase